MRIVGGQWRARRIEWPATGLTRPITDRVKTSLFDILGSRFGTPGELPPLRVADVFCGGGSLGLEALSRGAARACFFERYPEAVAVLRRNLGTLRVGPEAMVVVSDVYRAGIRPPTACMPLDLLFLDPPYLDARDTGPASKLSSLLRRLGTSDATAESVVVVLRHEKRVDFRGTIGKHWLVDDRRVYGRMAITILARLRQIQSDSDGSEAIE